MFKTNTIVSSNINNYCTLNSEHKWEDLCTQHKFYCVNLIDKGWTTW